MKLIKCELTPKERLRDYALGKEVDRIPTTITASETIPPLYGIKMKDYYFSSDLMVQVENNLFNDFGADNMGIGLGLRTLAEGLGTELSYSDNAVAFIKEPLINDYSKLDNLDLININKDGRFPIIIEAISKLQNQHGQYHNIGTGMAGPISTAAALRGTDNLLRDLIKNKENAHKLLDYTTECIIECARQMHNTLGISIGLSDPIASGNLISVKQFKEFELPYLIKIVKAFKEIQGSAPSIHICGKTKDRWQYIYESGVSSFSADNIENLEEFKNIYGNKIGVSGNVDPVNILRNGTKEQIIDGVKKCILQASDNPKGFTLSPGCTTPLGTSKDNIITFMNAAAIYGRGAKKGQLCKGIAEL